MTPEVTYILCCFNQAAYVNTAVDSALGQDFKGTVEYLAIDDGSNDGSAELLRKAAIQNPSRHIRVISDGANRGLTARLNQAIHSSSGKLIIIQACDDVAHSSRITDFVRYFRDHPEANFVFADVRRIDAEGRVLSDEHRSPLFRKVAGDVNNPKYIRRFAIGCNEAFRRDCLVRLGGFEEGLMAAEDHQLIVFSKVSGGIHFIPKPTLDYRSHNLNWCGAGRTAIESPFNWERLLKGAQSTLTNAEITLRLLDRQPVRRALSDAGLAREITTAKREYRLHMLRWIAVGGTSKKGLKHVLFGRHLLTRHAFFSVAILVGGQPLAHLIWRLNSFRTYLR